MSSTFDDAVFDFDLNFLNQSSKSVGTAYTASSTNKAEKQRKAVILAKKKTVATDSLIRKYYEKKEILDQTERDLVASKDECRQVCVNYKILIEKCGNLEQQMQQLQNENQELHTQYSSIQNQYVALQSHANQLQVLVKDYESRIDNIKEEHKLEFKMQDKKNKFAAQRSVNEMLKRHIKLFIEVAVGKKKLSEVSKDVLKRYEDTINKVQLELKSSESTMDIDPKLHIEKETVLHSIMEYKAGNGKAIRLESDHDLDEVDSSGRGSSLAFSDSEKYFQSPEYSMQNSPASYCVQVKQVSVASSPITVMETVNRAVSPIIFENHVSLPMICIEEQKNTPPLDNKSSADKEIQVCFDIPHTVPEKIVKKTISTQTTVLQTKVQETNTFYPETVTIAVQTIVPETVHLDAISVEMVPNKPSPILLRDSDLSVICPKITVISSSPTNSEALPSPVDFSDPYYDDNDEMQENSEITDHSCNKKDSIVISQEMKCLEQNNSKTICDANSDFEVERILNIMRCQQYKMITPIPTTPIKSIDHCDRAENKTDTTIREHLPHYCKESAQIREETKVLHAGLAHLTKEILCIKSILKNQLPEGLLHDTSKNMESDQDYNVYSHTMKHIQTIETMQSKLVLPRTEPTTVKVIVQDPPSCLIFDKPSETFNQHIDKDTASIIEKLTTVDPLRTEKTLTDVDPLTAEDTLTDKDTPSDEETPIDDAIPTAEDIPMADAGTSTIHKRLQFEDAVLTEECHDVVTDDTECLDDTGPDLIICNYDEPVIDNSVENIKSKKHREKLKKLTKLEKIRKRLIPKAKIAPTTTMKKKKIANNKLISNIYKPKKIITDADNASTLNDKRVYEKALSVMAELKSKQLKPRKKTVLKRKVEKSSTISIVKTINQGKNVLVKSPLTSPVKEDNNKNILFEPIISNSSNKRPRRNSEFPSKPDLDNSYDEIESPRKLRPRGLKRTAESKSPEESHKSTGIQNRRVLRSSVHQLNFNEPDVNVNESISTTIKKLRKISVDDTKVIMSPELQPMVHIEPVHIENIVQDNSCKLPESSSSKKDHVIECAQLKNATSMKNLKETVHSEVENTRCSHPKDSILCTMIEQHASYSGRRSRKTADSVSTLICNKIAASIAHIIDLPEDKSKSEMHKLVVELQNWKLTNFLSGFTKYLTDSERKVELFNKIMMPPAPSMTKPEQIILYVLEQLNNSKVWNCNVINSVLDSIEFTLFQLNNSPDFDVVESMAHFYAVLCRYIKAKSRLRLFIMDAMYCIQFKSIPLIKQSLSVWMHILPISNSYFAKSPLVTVLVYLLHFYKCEDRFNRVSELRYLLQKKYHYNFSEWNDHKILDMLKSSIKQLRDLPIERKMMRLALIIISKRLGVRWSQENIIKKLLLPFIEKEDVSEKTREFCVSMLGPLLRPYPADMRVHCEIIVNQMMDMLDQNPSPTMEEAIYTSLVYINRHNPQRILKALITWSPKKVSPQFEELLKDFIRTKPVKGWKIILSKLPID